MQLYKANSIKKEIKKAGHRVTPTLVNNIRKLNELQGKDLSFAEIMEMHKNITISEKEKYLIKAITDECKLQLKEFHEPEL